MKRPKLTDAEKLERRRAYQREYRRTHPEKVKQYRKNAIRAAYRRLMEQEGGNLNG